MTVSRRNAPDRARLLNDAEVAARLGVSRRTAREMRYLGDLPTVNLGYRTKRVRESDVDRLVRRRITPPAGR